MLTNENIFTYIKIFLNCSYCFTSFSLAVLVKFILIKKGVYQKFIKALWKPVLPVVFMLKEFARGCFKK